MGSLVVGIIELRQLCAWYEWGTVPSYKVVAEVLQDAADALRVHALSPEAAEAMLAAWQPFVGREAAVGNLTAKMNAPDDDAVTVGVVRYAVEDLKRMLVAAPDADKPRLAQLLHRQSANLAKHEERSR